MIVVVLTGGIHAAHGVQLAVHCVLGFAEVEVCGAEGGEERDEGCNRNVLGEGER